MVADTSGVGHTESFSFFFSAASGPRSTRVRRPLGQGADLTVAARAGPTGRKEAGSAQRKGNILEQFEEPHDRKWRLLGWANQRSDSDTGELMP
jgi:hypothetical protein